MGYVFEQHESIAANINRILTDEVKAARDALDKPGQVAPETIHGIRKRIKKIRALFRLVRSELTEEDFKRANRHYRAIGQQLSSLRDATVMIKTLDKLRQAQPASLSAQLFGSLRKALVRQQEQATNAFYDNATQIDQVVSALDKAPQRVRGLSKHHTGFRLMAPNLKRTYRRARKALKEAIHEPSIDHFHELRKEVKTLWYHTRLLQPIWPGLFKAYAHELSRLGELLGDDHDFGVLAQLIESDRLVLRNEQSRELLLQGLQRERTHLQEQIYPLANRLLAEKAGEFVRRFRLHWKRWRVEISQEPIDHQLQAT